MEPTEAERKAALALVGLLQKGAGMHFMSNDKFFDQFQACKNWAMRCLKDDGFLTMAFMLHGRHRIRKDEWVVMPVSMNDWPPPDGKKYEAMQGLGVMFVEQYPEHMLMAVYHASEAWQAYYKPEQSPKDHSGILPEGVPTPKERPDREEVLIVTGCTIDQRRSQVSMQMLRDEEGRFEKFGWKKELMYDPEAPPIDPRESVDYLTMHLFMGYFAASNPRAGV